MCGLGAAMVQVSLKRGNWWDVAYFPRFVYVGKMPHFPETLKNGACIWYFSGFVMVVFSKTYSYDICTTNRN